MKSRKNWWREAWKRGEKKVPEKLTPLTRPWKMEDEDEDEDWRIRSRNGESERGIGHLRQCENEIGRLGKVAPQSPLFTELLSPAGSSNSTRLLIFFFIFVRILCVRKLKLFSKYLFIYYFFKKLYIFDFFFRKKDFLFFT